jgi:type II secretory pathway pseudopilin PulG
MSPLHSIKKLVVTVLLLASAALAVQNQGKTFGALNIIHPLCGPMGQVNTTGTAVVWASGLTFNQATWTAGVPITIGNSTFLIASVTDTTHLTLQTSAGSGGPVNFFVGSATGSTGCGITQNYQGAMQIFWNSSGVGKAGTNPIYAGPTVQIPMNLYDFGTSGPSYDFRGVDIMLNLLLNCNGLPSTGAGCGATFVNLLLTFASGAGASQNTSSPNYIYSSAYAASLPGNPAINDLATCGSYNGSQFNNGTVTLNNGTSTLSGTGTNFQTSWAAGTPIVIGPLAGSGGTLFHINSCSSTTACTIQETAGSQFTNTNWNEGSPQGVNFTGVAGVTLRDGTGAVNNNCTVTCNYNINSGLADVSTEPILYEVPAQTAIQSAFTAAIKHFIPAACSTVAGSTLTNDCANAPPISQIGYITVGLGTGPESFAACGPNWPFAAPFIGAEDAYVGITNGVPGSTTTNYQYTQMQAMHNLDAAYSPPFALKINFHIWGPSEGSAATQEALYANTFNLGIGNNGENLNDFQPASAGNASWITSFANYPNVPIHQMQPISLDSPDQSNGVNGNQVSLLQFCIKHGCQAFELQFCTAIFGSGTAKANFPTGPGAGNNDCAVSYTQAQVDNYQSAYNSYFKQFSTLTTQLSKPLTK